jgi:hypothetical protein
MIAKQLIVLLRRCASRNDPQSDDRLLFVLMR